VALQLGPSASGEDWTLPFEKTLITRPGTPVPWELLPAAWGLLDVWDAAVPLWEYTRTAVSVGRADEREITRMIIRDLRVLLHSVELLFVRRNEAGQKLMHSWLGQIQLGDAQVGDGGDQRLAFLRALYMVKPRLCVLPTSWVSGGRVTVRAAPARPINGGQPMVQVDLGNGRFVKCHAGDENQVRQMFNSDRRHDMAIVSRKSFTVENQKTRASKGPLVRVELAPGQFVKMYEQDAIEAGHIQPKEKPVEKAEEKSRPPEGNKMRPPSGDKASTGSASGESADTAESDDAAAGSGHELPDDGMSSAPDDFAKHINGVGLATARLLNSHGIFTFDQLRAAEDLSFLPPLQQQAVEDWRNG
jgi:predicted flap endonuclease-1-like 5' DNA nuclease